MLILFQEPEQGQGQVGKEEVKALTFRANCDQVQVKAQDRAQARGLDQAPAQVDFKMVKDETVC